MAMEQIVMRLSRMVSTCIFALLAGAFLTGCPRFSEVVLYNNAGADLTLNIAGQSYVVADGSVARFRYTATSVEVKSALGLWTYERNIPHGGSDGPFFDGTLRLQIEPNGTLYALKPDQIPPLDFFPEQPAGYPMSPAAER